MQDAQLGLFCTKEEMTAQKKSVYWYDEPFLALDVETTGLNPREDRVLELALVPFNIENTIKEFCELFDVERSLPKEIIKITGITESMLIGKPKIAEFFPKILNLWTKAKFIVAYNVKFDRPFLEEELARMNKSLPDLPWIDPFVFICSFDKFKKGKKLSDAALRWGVELNQAHRALSDAKACGELLLKMKLNLKDLTITELLDKQNKTSLENDQNRNDYFSKKNGWSVDR